MALKTCMKFMRCNTNIVVSSMNLQSRNFSRKSQLLTNNSPWINVEQISDRIWKVMENDKFGETPFLYSIMGTDKIVLIDTGVNSGDYKSYLRSWPQFKSLPFLVINTHVHFDHVGGNHYFSGRKKLADDCLDVCLWGGEKKFTLGYNDPKIDASLIYLMKTGINVEEFSITRWLNENDIIYLDDKNKNENNALHILHLPGHTPDSIGINFPAERRIFVGDHVYRRSPLILYDSTPDVFKKSVIKLKDYIIDRYGELSHVNLSCSHQDTNLPASKLEELIELLNGIECGKVKGQDASMWQKYAPRPVMGYKSENFLVLSK